MTTYHLPDIAIPDGFTYESYLRHLTEEGLRWRYAERADDPEIRARMTHELKIIHDMGFDIYFLIVWDLCMYAQRRGIWWNVRGSGAGSIVAYAIGVTNLDPLRNKLIFERFLNPGRVTMPDFDLDFPDDQREELIRYTLEKYGSHRVAQVVTFGRMKARAAVRDVGRTMGIELAEVDSLAKLIPAIPGKPVTIKDVLTEGNEFYSADLKRRYDEDEQVRKLLDTGSHLEGVARHSSIHAAAVIIADEELTHYTPLMRPPKSAITETVTQYEFPILESIGLLKVDFLGLATLTLMRECTRLIKERHGIEYTLHNLPIDDPKIYELLTAGDVMGVFQVEGQGMRRVPDGHAADRVRSHHCHDLALPPRPDGVHPRLHRLPPRRAGAELRPSDPDADPGRDDGGVRQRRCAGDGCANRPPLPAGSGRGDVRADHPGC